MILDDGQIIEQVIQTSGMRCTINRYQSGGFVGRGGYAYCVQVRKFQGHSNEHLEEAAVLKISNSQAQNKRIKQIYENQVKVLSILNGEYSNHFVRCFTHWKTASPNRSYIILEKCEYGSLQQLLEYVEEQGKRLTELQILYFLREILKAVRIMHKLKIIHRDLKLQNVMIGKDMEIKLIDFGLANIGKEGQEAYDDAYEGTPSHMSPEIFKGEQYSYEVDMWALGIMLYHLIYFDVPFKGTSRNELHELVTNSELKLKNKNGSAELRQLVKGLLNQDKKSRWTAAELLKNQCFDKLQTEQDLKRRIQFKYRDYFLNRSKKRAWKKVAIRQPLRLQPKIIDKQTFSNQQKGKICASLIQIAKRKAKREQKVKIIQLIHNVKYGYFFLLSNLALIGYFNNHRILKFTRSLLSKPTKANEQLILCFIYQQYFMEYITKQSAFNVDAQLDEPNCTLKKVLIHPKALFVRLSNHVLQVYIQQQNLNRDASSIFTIQLHYNTNIQDQKEITIVTSTKETLKLKDYAQAVKSAYSPYIQFVKSCFEIILDNSAISFDQLQLQRWE